MSMKNKEDPNITYLLEEYTQRLVDLIEQRTVTRLQDLAQSITGLRPRVAAPHPALQAIHHATVKLGSGDAAPKRSTRPRAPRFCPVPGCKNPPAPVYGMVCREHQHVPKAEIKKYREARKAGLALPEAPKAKRGRPAIPVSRD